MPFMNPGPDSSMLEDLATPARRDLERIANGLRAKGMYVDTKVVVNELAAVSILTEAESTDMIVLTTHGRGRVARFLLGSVTDKVVRAATCPVLIVRSPSQTGGAP
jgi:nucleotide-binding universal stress UspA family protein